MNVIATLFKIIAGVFLLAGVLFLAGAGWTGYRRYSIMERWPQVDAVVTESHITSRQRTSTDRNHHTTTTTVYLLELAFRYTVAGHEYVTGASSPYSTNLYSVIKHQADEYAPGTRHPIRYNPSDPNDIAYNVGWNFGFVLLPVMLGIFGITSIIVGGGLVGVIRRAKASTCPSCGQAIPQGMLTCPKCGAAAPAQPNAQAA